MAIRHASAEDVADLLPLFRAYCDFYEADPTDAGVEEMIRAAIDLPDDQAFLLMAEDGDESVGFAACSWKWSSLRGARIVVLEDLYVREGSRGEGHADSLIAASAALGKEHGAPVLTWLTAPDNVRAQAVYNRVGGTSEPFLEYELEL
jgi:ribosomal protein S18 acetylase RimI-like enzyme